MSVGGSAWKMVRHGADFSRKGYGSSYDPRIAALPKPSRPKPSKKKAARRRPG